MQVRLTIGKARGERATVICDAKTAAQFAEAFARVAMNTVYGSADDGVPAFTLNRKSKAAVGVADSAITEFYLRVERVPLIR